MFILTINSNDYTEITKVMRDIAKTNVRDNVMIGEVGGNKYEFDILPQQEFIYMADFLHFNPDGNTLKPTRPDDNPKKEAIF